MTILVSIFLFRRLLLLLLVNTVKASELPVETGAVIIGSQALIGSLP